MEQKNYHSSIIANVRPKEAFDNIARIDKWWAKSFDGRATTTGDKFSVHFGTTMVAFEITEAVPEQKVAWMVTDCHLPFLKNKTEWTGTSIEWKIAAHDNTTKIDMTHIGLVPGIECYEACNAGWNEHILGSLNKLLNEGEGKPS